MARQDETVLISDPFRNYLKHMGWHTEKTHGSQFQTGFPDLRIMHPKYEPRWVETKLIHGNTVHLTTAQLQKFPIWILNGEKIWVIAGRDFRGIEGKQSLIRAYQRLFEPPNAYLFFHSSTYKYVID
jgi:hypothetical protein